MCQRFCENSKPPKTPTFAEFVKEKIRGRRNATVRDSFSFKAVEKIFFETTSSNQSFLLHKTPDTANFSIPISM